jgi:hypothetical protein
MIDLQIRSGTPADQSGVLGLFDEAVQSLVARGLVGQWGEAPFSTRPEMRERVQAMLTINEARIAEHAAEPVGSWPSVPLPPTSRRCRSRSCT